MPEVTPVLLLPTVRFDQLHPVQKACYRYGEVIGQQLGESVSKLDFLQRILVVVAQHILG